MIRHLALVCTIALPCLLDAQTPSGATHSSPEILTSGSGVVKLKPDRATLTVAVVTRANSAAEAGRLNVIRILPVIAALKRQGLPDSAIVTTGYTVSIERDAMGRVPVPTDAKQTYVARNAIRVSLMDIESLGQLVDTTLLAGASEVANISFASSQAVDARQRAIAAAVRAARVDAETAAAAAGGVLGALIEVSLLPLYGVAGGRAGDYYQFSAAAVATPLMPSDVTVSVEARVRFAFMPRP
ncbi:MAG: SIMPL domain-containing protein [Gemmatimonadaceae bacterium]|jgi:hypothetical protein|nr:SIMPL domain-containing protein [Gemmatimonadaceae bacterium]